MEIMKLDAHTAAAYVTPHTCTNTDSATKHTLAPSEVGADLPVARQQ